MSSFAYLYKIKYSWHKGTTFSTNGKTFCQLFLIFAKDLTFAQDFLTFLGDI